MPFLHFYCLASKNAIIRSKFTMNHEFENKNAERWPGEKKDSQWYEETFRRKWKLLRPYGFEAKWDEQYYGADVFGLKMKKLTYATLYELLTPGKKTRSFEILIGSEWESGYFPKHDELLEEYQLPDKDFQQNKGVIFEDREGRKFMILDEMQPWVLKFRQKERNDPDFEKKMKNALDRYGVTAVFCARAGGSNKIRPFGEFAMVIEKDFFESAYKVFYEGFCLHLAIKEQWNIWQWLRFRMTGELPEFPEKHLPKRG